MCPVVRYVGKNEFSYSLGRLLRHGLYPHARLHFLLLDVRVPTETGEIDCEFPLFLLHFLNINWITNVRCCNPFW